jgi:hypothetical protein
MGQPAADAHSALREVATRQSEPPGRSYRVQSNHAAALTECISLAWLTDMLERTISGRTKANELERLLPWNWKMARPIDT